MSESPFRRILNEVRYGPGGSPAPPTTPAPREPRSGGFPLWGKIACGLVVLLLIASVIGGGDDEQEKSGAATQAADVTTTDDAAPARQVVALQTTSPAKAGSTVHKKRLKFTGTATPGADVQVASKQTQASSAGRWRTTVPLEVGNNEIEVTAELDGYDAADPQVIKVKRKRTAAEIAAARAKREAAEARARAKREAARARRAAAAAARVANFKASAKSIAYNQLAKNPLKYEGDHVVFRGQIAEVQEDYGTGIMRLNVTDEGYDIWTDDVWVDYEGEIKSAQDDIVTIYGTITGEKSYDTEIGGSRSIPQIKMRYIDE